MQEHRGAKMLPTHLLPVSCPSVHLSFTKAKVALDRDVQEHIHLFPFKRSQELYGSRHGIEVDVARMRIDRALLSGWPVQRRVADLPEPVPPVTELFLLFGAVSGEDAVCVWEHGEHIHVQLRIKRAFAVRGYSGCWFVDSIVYHGCERSGVAAGRVRQQVDGRSAGTALLFSTG